jgi:hypothetical protein
MRYTKREMHNVEPKAGQRGLSVARITTHMLLVYLKLQQ